MTSLDTQSLLLRRALGANGVFSGVSGLAMISASEPLTAFLGIGKPAILIGIGVLLVLYAVGLVANSRRNAIHLGEARVAIGLDMAWVIGSALLLGTGWLTRAGAWTVAIVADVVLFFAVLQVFGLRRAVRAQASEP